MSNLILSPTACAKTKTIEAANKIRHGSPKLHEVLRQRCRERMREKRGQLFNGRRLGLETPPEDVQETLTNILRKEFEEIISTDRETNSEIFNTIFNSPLELEEALELEAEILAEEEQWIVEEYCRELQAEEERLSEEVVFCPICLTTVLQEIPGFITCSSCKIKFPAQTSLVDFHNKILESANVHSLKCIQRPIFTILPSNDKLELFLTCEICSSFSSVFD